MTPSFLVMAAGVFLAGAAMGAVGGALATLGAHAWTKKLTPRSQAGFWMLVAAAPWVAGLAALVATMLPSFGLAADHCLVHGSHHPHLCLHHPQALSVPALILVVIGVVRIALVSTREARTAWRTHQTVATLDSSATECGDIRVLPGTLPAAFVVGINRTNIYVSRATMDLPEQLRKSVLAHERCHVKERHLLLRLLVRLLGSLQLPSLARQLDLHLAAAQELQADESAASAVGDRLLVAECLLELARARVGAPRGALAFTDGGVGARVLALSDASDDRKSWPVAITAAITLLAVGAAVTSPSVVHHAFESILGWLH